MWDNDGEFLLIEAAYSLPRWLKPELSENRVWLSGGALHLVPLPSPAAPTLPSAPSPAQVGAAACGPAPCLTGRAAQPRPSVAEPSSSGPSVALMLLCTERCQYFMRLLTRTLVFRGQGG